ncbi:MAG: PAS domain-containing sensor histidine kinase [Ignavibacteria bacterium]|nr:PAS domain-containing sensor histidine kinase [Ignavibacteria bacterium]
MSNENNIIEFKKNYERIVESFKCFYNSIIDAIYIQDFDGKFIDVNEGAVKMYGYERSEFIGRTPEFLSAPGMNDMEETMEHLKKAAKGELQIFEWWGRRKNGEIFPKEVILNKGKYFDKDVVIAVARDITFRKKMESKLQESEESYRTLAENLPAIVYRIYLKENNRIQFFNKYVEEMTGYTSESLCSHNKLLPLFSLMSDDEIEVAFSLINHSILHKNPFIIRYKIKDRNDNIKYLSERGRPIYDNNGSLIYIDGVIFDVTEKVLDLQRIEKYSKELEEINKSKDKFISILAHDLRNFTHILLNFSNSLYNDIDTLTKHQITSIANCIMSVSQNQSALLENLLEWSKLNLDKRKVEPEKVKLKELVSDVINLYNFNITTKKLSVKNSIPDNVLVFADKNTLKVIVRNLLSNSIKFSNPGGKIIIDHIYEGDKVKVFFIDYGVGIKKEIFDKLFSRDEFVSTRGTLNESGTGFGLLISKELAELNNGNITIDSKEQEGTKVTLILPLSD